MRLVLLIPLFLMGCRNDCQQLCLEISDLAAECGYEWTDKEERTCLADYRNTNTDRTYRESCSENIDFVREEWSCADMAAYFEDGSSGNNDEDVGSDTGS